ncbi:uncharacterized protein BXZ73DRAFT_80724 [Epithele typhae]|uniref:uncharacterized protein n=1 Tax=Epithele typhae TaxID=378194 RepID=UPI0020075FF7|nr:uncharacterized protein BXZ73DRAFT_80724 [Epithele typhae]KAH9917883.1 hypothetical protein BXZ73DRAFT_80724 [Epithele typhae]
MYTPSRASLTGTHEALLLPRGPQVGDERARHASVVSFLAGILIAGVLYGLVISSVRAYYLRNSSGDRWLKGLVIAFRHVHELHSHFVHHQSTSTHSASRFLGISTVFIRRLWKFSMNVGRGYARWLSFTGLAITFIVTISALWTNVINRALLAMMILSHLVSGSKTGSTNVTSTIASLSIASFSCGFISDFFFTAMFTDSTITILISYTIEAAMIPACVQQQPSWTNTNLSSSMCDTIGIIMFICRPGMNIYIPFFMQMGPLYFLSLLASLNSRRDLSRRINEPGSDVLTDDTLSHPTCNIHFASPTTYELASVKHAGSASEGDTPEFALVGPGARCKDVAVGASVSDPDCNRDAWTIGDASRGRHVEAVHERRTLASDGSRTEIGSQ